jgi:protein-tyrosine phosphatase
VIPSDTTPLVDIHNHLVPGVDDGVRDVDGALAAVERLVQLNVLRIVTTPHIHGSLTLDQPRYEARLQEVGDAFERARSAIRESFPDVTFHRGHEVMIDVPEVDLSDPRVRLAGTSYVLVEWPGLQIPPGTPHVIERIREQGHRPIIAHPERYYGLLRDFGLAGQWRSMGGYLQVNHGSLVGRYGREAELLAYRLLRQGWVDYLASDFHGHARLKIYQTEAWEELVELEAEEAAELLCRTNPSRLLDDLEPLPVPSLPPDPRFFRRLRRMLTWQRA